MVEPSADLDVVAAEWLRRATSEYATAAHAQTIGLWLVEIGASPDLILDTHRIAGEELDHASRCVAVHRSAGGGEVPHLDRGLLRLPESDHRERDVLTAIVRLFCFGETLAVSMFNEARLAASEPIARETLDRIVRDEVGHRRFGWEALDWFLDHGVVPDAPALIAEVVATTSATFARLYLQPIVSEERVGPAERAWGLTPHVVAATLVERAIAREWPRRLAARGLSAGG